jgi:hypothetical protein
VTVTVLRAALIRYVWNDECEVADVWQEDVATKGCACPRCEGARALGYPDVDRPPEDEIADGGPNNYDDGTEGGG